MRESVRRELISELKELAKISLDNGDFTRLERYSRFLKELGYAGVENPNRPGTTRGVMITQVPPRQRRARMPRGHIEFTPGTILVASTRNGDYHALVRESGLEFEGEVYANFSALGKAISGGKSTHLQQRKYWVPTEPEPEPEEEEDKVITKLRKAHPGEEFEEDQRAWDDEEDEDEG